MNDRALLLCSRSSAETTMSSPFPPGRQGAPPWQHPDPAHLTPALHKQGGDMKLAMLTLMGKAGLEGLFL